jgi:succinyl-CoA synthetase beta subunit
MNIHEYQAKAVLKSFGAPVADGVPVLSLDDVQKAVDTLPGPVWVVKSRSTQAVAARASSRSSEAGAKGGVRLAFSQGRRDRPMPSRCSATRWSPHRPARPASRSTASTSKTAPTSTASFISPSWLTAPSRVAFVVSTEGGMDIEQVAHDTPEKILTLSIDPETGVTDADIAKLNEALKLDGTRLKTARNCSRSSTRRSPRRT